MALRFLTAAITFAAIGALGPSEAAELVKNGDFTQLSNGVGQLNTNTSAAYWSTTDSSFNPASPGYSFVMNNGDAGGPGQYGNVALWTQTTAGNGWNGMTLSGNGNFLAMDGDFQTTNVTQVLHGLIPGDFYTITFNTALAQQTGWFGPTTQDITVYWGSSFSEELYLSNFGSSYALPSQGFSGWTQWTGSLQADASNEVLSFLAYGANPTGGGQLPPFALLSDVSVTGSMVPERATWAMMLAGFAGLGFAGFRSNRRKLAAIG